MDRLAKEDEEGGLVVPREAGPEDLTQFIQASTLPTTSSRLLAPALPPGGYELCAFERAWCIVELVEALERHKLS